MKDKGSFILNMTAYDLTMQEPSTSVIMCWFIIPKQTCFSTRALYYQRFCDTSQEFQPMASQLSKKAALPLAKILATCRNNVSNTGPSRADLVTQWGDNNGGQPWTGNSFLSCNILHHCQQECFWFMMTPSNRCRSWLHTIIPDIVFTSFSFGMLFSVMHFIVSFINLVH